MALTEERFQCWALFNKFIKFAFEQFIKFSKCLMHMRKHNISLLFSSCKQWLRLVSILVNRKKGTLYEHSIECNELKQNETLWHTCAWYGVIHLHTGCNNKITTLYFIRSLDTVYLQPVKRSKLCNFQFSVFIYFSLYWLFTLYQRTVQFHYILFIHFLASTLLIEFTTRII